MNPKRAICDFENMRNGDFGLGFFSRGYFWQKQPMAPWRIGVEIEGGVVVGRTMQFLGRFVGTCNQMQQYSYKVLYVSWSLGVRFMFWPPPIFIHRHCSVRAGNGQEQQGITAKPTVIQWRSRNKDGSLQVILLQIRPRYCC